jgi:PAS domain S-box-containing protein
MTGYSKEEIRGKNLNFLFNQKRDYKKMVGQLHQIHGNEETVAMETQWRRRDGQVRDIYLNFSLIDKTDPGKNLIFAAMDISDLKKMEKERLRMDNLESLGIMAGGIAHDFNNILTIIMGNIELVGLEIKHPDKSLARLLEAEQACQRARHLAKQLLTFAKGGMPIKKPRLAGELLQNVVPLALSGSNSAVEISIDDNTWPIDIDEAQIQQVINNILINADQAMPDGGLITITVTNQALTPAHGIPLPSGNYVKISVIDQGIGISEKDLGKIFDPYFTTKQLGNGLGLTAAFSIIKNHQGYISVDSKLGQGSRFHIYLPAATTAPLICDTKVSEIPIRGYGRILVMDDEPAILVVLSQMLNKLGYEAVCVENGQQVLETYQRAQKSNRFFDAAILDLTIPGGLGGKETIEILRKLDPHVQVIVSSGYANDPIMADYEKFGFNGVIAKPYKILELSLILHNLLTSKKSLGQQIQNEDTTNLQNDTR